MAEKSKNTEVSRILNLKECNSFFLNIRILFPVYGSNPVSCYHGEISRFIYDYDIGYTIPPMIIKDAVFVYQMQDESEIKWHGRLHAHSLREYELHYFIQGSGHFINDQAVYTIKPGTLIMASPFIRHSIQVDDLEKPISYYAVLFHLEAGEAELQRLIDEDINHKKTRDIGTSYRFFFEEIRERGLSGNRNLHLSAVHQMIGFLYLLAEESDFHYGDAGNQHIEKALRIMHNSITEDLRLDKLAEKLNLTESYFIRLFKRKMQMTPMKYYTRLKIEAAGAMLSGTSLPVYIISGKLHFYSEFHFSKVFKRYTGSSPTRYRKLFLQKLGNV